MHTQATATLETSIPCPPNVAAPRETPDAERLRRFGEAIDAVRKRIEAKIGDEDVRYVKRLNAFSRMMEGIGRVLIHVSFEPVGFTAGVLSLWIHKQLQATEIGHTTLHGAFDGLEGAEAFQSKSFWWEVPIDEAGWREGHNVRHHQYTNITGKDPDIHFGPVRLNDRTPHRAVNYVQLPFFLFALAPNFGFLMNFHFTGLEDIYGGNGRPEKYDYIEKLDWKTVKEAHRKALRKWIPYYAKEYVFFPALAGPFFWKTLLGNWMTETMRDLYSAATIYCGHVGDDVADFDEGAKARSRGEWYAMQVEAANNFEVSHPLSVLCGALDLQIEHHLFPKWPTNRLREAAPEIRRICEEHGVAYKTDTWGRTLAKVIRRVARLSLPTARERRERSVGRGVPATA
ncbi:MAG: fatty acid desaturase [Myxococcales bacterium]|nr:fatty acid desaturase [Myxococcales bacterium]